MCAYFISRITNNIRADEEIAYDEQFMNTTHFDAINDRYHSYHVDQNSFAGFLPRHEAAVHNREVEIDNLIVHRKVLEVRLLQGNVIIEIGPTVDTSVDGRVLQSAIYGDVRDCAEVVQSQITGTYEYTGEHKAVKLIMKSMLEVSRVENPLKEIAATQFIHGQFVRPSLHHDLHYYYYYIFNLIGGMYMYVTH